MHLIQKTFVIVIESLGVGEAPDAKAYDDLTANTVSHVADYTGGLNLPTLARLGLGNITYVKGVGRSNESIAYYGKCRQTSDGKDSVIGHWEIAGYNYTSLYHTDRAGFFPQFIEKLERELGKKCIYNMQYKANQVMDRYYYDHITEKAFIVFYNKDDLSLNIAANPDVLSIADMAEVVRLTHEIGDYYGFIRTRGISIKHDEQNRIVKKILVTLSRKPIQSTVLGACKNAGIPVHLIARSQNIFHSEELSSQIITQSDEESAEKLIEISNSDQYSNEHGQGMYYLVFSDINDNWGNQKKIREYADALVKIDKFLQKFLRSMNSSDILIITASNGNDPSLQESIHTREYLPVMAYSRVLGVRSDGNLGVRRTLTDIAETISDIYDLDTHYGGDSFWNHMLSQI